MAQRLGKKTAFVAVARIVCRRMSSATLSAFLSPQPPTPLPVELRNEDGWGGKGGGWEDFILSLVTGEEECYGSSNLPAFWQCKRSTYLGTKKKKGSATTLELFDMCRGKTVAKSMRFGDFLTQWCRHLNFFSFGVGGGEDKEGR